MKIVETLVAVDGVDGGDTWSTTRPVGDGRTRKVLLMESMLGGSRLGW